MSYLKITGNVSNLNNDNYISSGLTNVVKYKSIIDLIDTSTKVLVLRNFEQLQPNLFKIRKSNNKNFSDNIVKFMNNVVNEQINQVEKDFVDVSNNRVSSK